MKATCLARALQCPGLPAQLDVLDKQGKAVMTTAILHANGTITDQSSNITYDCPSLLRHALHGPNRPTYPFLVYRGPAPGSAQVANAKHLGQTLRDLGVQC